MGITIDLTNDEGRTLVKLRGCTRYSIIDAIIDMVEQELPPLVSWDKEATGLWHGTCEDDDDNQAYVFNTDGGKYTGFTTTGSDWRQHGLYATLEEIQTVVEERFS